MTRYDQNIKQLKVDQIDTYDFSKNRTHASFLGHVW